MNKIEGIHKSGDDYHMNTYISSSAAGINSRKTKYHNIPPGLISGIDNTLIIASSILKPRYGKNNVNFSDIFSLNLESGVLAQLTYQGQNLAPAVSPDGNQIIFYSFPDKDLTNDATDTQDSTDFKLILMGTKDRKSAILDSSIYRLHDFWDKPPVWSPDGNKILFHKRITPDTSPRLFIIDVSEKNTKEFSNIALWPSWSPDCLWIAYSKPGINGYEIFKKNTQTGEEVLLISDEEDNTHPVWSPDGKWICFIKNNLSKGEKNLFRVDNSGQNVEILVKDIVIQDQLNELFWIPD